MNSRPDFATAVQRRWYGRAGWLWLLLPLEWLYRAVVALRRWAYRRGLTGSMRLPVPVIVVGNISVGGTGKTPVVAALCRALVRAGHRPGIVSRGYGAQPPHLPYVVTPGSSVVEAGDEPLLLARTTGCPVCIDPDRVAAARNLLALRACDVVVCDDGLQHLRLQRDIEIVVVDGSRGLGNGRCLPVGPLREPAARLLDVDAVLVNTTAAPDPALPGSPQAFHLQPRAYVALADGRELAPDAWQRRRVHAVAGIGHPQRFFATLRGLGLDVVEHSFPDHHAFTAADLAFGDDLPVVMTEKDAVKCAGLAGAGGERWYLAVDAVLPDSLTAQVIGRMPG